MERNPKENIVITAMGITSCLGMNVQENHLALKNKICGIGDITILDTNHRGNLPAGEIKYTNVELREKTKFSDTEIIPRSVLLSIPAIEELLANAGNISLDDTDLYYATTVGGIDLSEDVIKDKLQNKDTDINILKYHDSGASAKLLASYFNLQGQLYTLSTACSSAANAIGLAAQKLKSGRCKFAIAGGGDALSRFTMNGFNSLMILDKTLCRPFDDTRKGLNLGEGAAFLLLETEENALARGAHILARVMGFGNANDSFHQTASSDEGHGAFRAMYEALQDAQLDTSDINYINAHGTGTQNNDLSEGNAIQRLFQQVPPISSTKSYTGHTLAASGSIEAVFSVLSLINQEVYPTLRFQQNIPGHRFSTFADVQKMKVNYILSNALGFGGNSSALVFGKYNK